jgi:hypothetical protein
VRQGNRDAGDPGEDEEVEAVQCSGFEPDENLARAGRRIGTVAVLERVEAAVRRKKKGLHGCLPGGGYRPGGYHADGWRLARPEGAA